MGGASLLACTIFALMSVPLLRPVSSSSSGASGHLRNGAPLTRSDRRRHNGAITLDSAWMQSAPVLPSSGSVTRPNFVLEVKNALDQRRLNRRPRLSIFGNSHDIPHAPCHGSWLEFGVFDGSSINLSAKWREEHCGQDTEKLYGFDNFTGLPEDWRSGMPAAAFSRNGVLPRVEPNVELVKGMFNHTLPGFIKRVLDVPGHPGITYLHIDCDLYGGAIEALISLNKYIHPGCVLVFDELVNYVGYEEHEIKALWEWVVQFQRRVAVIGVHTPSDAKEAMLLDNSGRSEADAYQSVGFVVVE